MTALNALNTANSRPAKVAETKTKNFNVILSFDLSEFRPELFKRSV